MAVRRRVAGRGGAEAVAQVSGGMGNTGAAAERLHKAGCIAATAVQEMFPPSCLMTTALMPI